MKKILLGTSAIVGASVLLASPVWAAEKPQLKMDGFVTFEAWGVSNDLPTGVVNTSTQGTGTGFATDDAEIHFQGSAKADNGLEYGFYVELQEGNTDGSAGYDEANVFLSGNWGRVDLGAQDPVENNFKPGGYSVIADKDGGWDGSGKNAIATLGNSAPTGTDLDSTGDANKITYYTPSFSGFQAGVSFTPASQASMSTAFTTQTAGKYENAVGYAAMYKGTVGGVDIQASARGMKSAYQANDFGGTTAELEDYSAWGVGGVVGYAGFQLGASYQDMGDGGITKANKALGQDNGKYYDVGLSYSTGPYKVSVAYLHGWAGQASSGGVATQDDKVSWYNVAANYNAAPGLDIYASYQYVDLDQQGSSSDNTADVFLIGTKVSF